MRVKNIHSSIITQNKVNLLLEKLLDFKNENFVLQK